MRKTFEKRKDEENEETLEIVSIGGKKAVVLTDEQAKLIDPFGRGFATPSKVGRGLKDASRKG